MVSAFQTIQYTVTFRRGPGESPEREIRNSKEAAYVLAMEIELNGGLAMVVATPKNEPLSSTRILPEGE